MNEAQQAALDEYAAAIREGNDERAAEIREGLGALEGGTDDLETVAEQMANEGNPDEALAEAVEALEPAAGEVAEAALEAGRPDLAAEVVTATLETLADWAEGAESLAETIEDVAAEIEDDGAIAAASEASQAAVEAGAAVEETLEEAGIPTEIAEELTDPADGSEVYVEDIAPEPSHWLLRRRFSR